MATDAITFHICFNMAAIWADFHVKYVLVTHLVGDIIAFVVYLFLVLYFSESNKEYQENSKFSWYKQG